MKRTGFCDGWEFSRNGGAYSSVVVPHDAMLGERRDAQAPSGSTNGYFYGGAYRYRKRFTLSEEQAENRLLLEFEGVYRDARIQVNGTQVDAPPYGFVPFFADLTGLVRPGENLIEVETDNSNQPDCRWYSGAGIQRPVWLWQGGRDCIEPEGIRVTTLSLSPTVIRVDVTCVVGKTIGNTDAEMQAAPIATPPSAVVPVISILNENDDVIATARGKHAEIAITRAHLWNVESPYLYRCVVELERDGDIADRAECRFGIRMLSWSPDGLFVNGRETLLRGGCIHCDNGILGAASFPESERRRIRLLKDAGFNAVRIAHNPAPAALLDACDELGMFVVDELWDMWFTPKSAYDYSQHFLDWFDYDLNRTASRDYNHPSVIMYSIGNEVADPIMPEGVDLERSMVELLHSIDPTRPVTCGLNLAMMVMERAGQRWYANADGVAAGATAQGAPHGSLLFNLMAQASGAGITLLASIPGADKLVSPALDALDIAGYNYATTRYGVDSNKHPHRIIVGTETFPHELARNWNAVMLLPNVIGDFMWAAWDYLGEAGAGSWTYTAEETGFSKPWPWLLAGSGALDIFGNPNAHAALAGAVWNTEINPSLQVRPVNHMKEKTYKATWRGSDAIPSWSWKGCEGTTAQVEVYDGRAYSIQLTLNGEFIGQKRVRDCVARFSLPYHQGTLTAIALFKDGGEIGRSSLVSAQGPLHLDACPENRHPRAGGIAYVPVNIAGSNGQVESNADERLTATVEGGDLLAFGSAQPAPTESFLDGAYTTYRGRAMAVVHRDTPGVATLTICGTTLAPVTVELTFV